MISSDLHILPNEDSSFFLQLQSFVCLFSALIRFLLRNLMIEVTLGVEKYLTFTVFLLNILCRWLFDAKCLYKRSRNICSRSLMYLCLFRLLLFLLSSLYLKSTFLYPMVFNAVSYSTSDAWKIYAFEEFLDNLLLIVFGNFFIVSGGWFEFPLIYRSLSLGFLQGLYELFIMLTVTCKKSAILKFVSMSVLKSISLKIFLIFLRSWSIC